MRDTLPQMTQAKFYPIAGFQDTTLNVFYTKVHCWQFRVISSGGAVFGERKIYYTAEATEKAGREWIATGT